MTLYESACRAGKYLADAGKEWVYSFWREDPDFRNNRKVEMLEEMAHGASPPVRAEVARCLGTINCEASKDLLLYMTSDDDPEVSEIAWRCLMRYGISRSQKTSDGIPADDL